MSYGYRFDPPTLSELDELAWFEIDCDHNCDKCEWDCGDDL